MKENKRKITIITIIGIILFSCVATLSYALWERLFTQSDENKITTLDCFDIKYTGGESVALNNVIPVPDEEGRNTTPYEVTIENKCDTTVKYNVILNNSKNSTLNETHVKVTSGGEAKLLSDTKEIETNTSLDGLDNYTTNNKSKVIGEGYSLPKTTKKVKVRTWIDNATTIEEGQNKTFTYKITIEATPMNGKPTINIFNHEYEIRTETPDFTKGYPTSTSGDELSGLYMTEDDDGDTYYFRGKVENNYVKLSQNSDLVWRIVRVNGDGTIRLILNEKENELSDIQFHSTTDNIKYVGYTYDNEKSCTNEHPCYSNYENGTFINSNGGTDSEVKTELEKWYQSNLTQYNDKIALTTFCNDTSYGSGEENAASSSSTSLEFKPHTRLRENPQLNLHCPDPTKKDGDNRDYGGVYKLKIGLLTADDVILGGYNYNEYTDNNNATTENYLYHDYYWWTMSPDEFSFSNRYGSVWDAGKGASFVDGYIIVSENLLPVINLKSDVTVTGSGTIDDPYVVQ